MKFLIAINFVLLAILSTSQISLGFEWSDCKGTAVKFNNYTLSPNPIVYPGNVVVGGDIEFMKDGLPNDSHLKLKLKLKKLIAGQLFSIPCIMGMGSCTYEFCKDDKASLKDIFFKSFQVNCPIQKRHYTIKDVSAPLPKFGNKLIEDNMTGHFEGRVEIFNDQTQEVYGCMDFKMDFVVKH